MPKLGFISITLKRSVIDRLMKYHHGKVAKVVTDAIESYIIPTKALSMKDYLTLRYSFYKLDTASGIFWKTKKEKERSNLND